MTILRTLQTIAAPCALALVLAGCSSQELYSQLSERQANEMVALLRNAGLSAEKQTHEGHFSVLTSSRDFSAAVRTLSAQGYPREQFDSMGKIFKREGFVSSPLEERARLVHALSQEISNTVAQIDGVVMARVHLVVPERNPLSDKLQPAAAAVFIKHRPDKDLAAQTAQIKALVVNSIEGLPYDNVTVALFPAESMPGDAARSAAAPGATAQRRPSLDLPLTAGAAAGTLALGGGGMLWWRRRSAAREDATVMLSRPAAGAPPVPRGGLPDELQAALRRAAGQR
ncbi:type III secretion inner membrane ring lipoprotein SctJ [Piscinibacter sp. XHJ-5]|uniref:type III secretion system inner membrane ring lipoprotein SctJ n=1 Tax=Piscinibacter sp. XHJ-5 TaxID=3037797 RepID=UPI002452A182|nr:type III secretion inner membrane ring lipoprotein SctJ [Piscinibacter sp. XHJ-5]